MLHYVKGMRQWILEAILNDVLYQFLFTSDTTSLNKVTSAFGTASTKIDSLKL